jgi:hypothetical protein
MNQILRDYQDSRLPARAAPSFDEIGTAAIRPYSGALAV